MNQNSNGIAYCEDGSELFAGFDYDGNEKAVYTVFDLTAGRCSC
ncbi:hypothetical protein QKW52_02485 [Bacillus sonorensis]|nr:hypothetical protein [Bacillus sonorensis]